MVLKSSLSFLDFLGLFCVCTPLFPFFLCSLLNALSWSITIGMQSLYLGVFGSQKNSARIGYSGQCAYMVQKECSFEKMIVLCYSE